MPEKEPPTPPVWARYQLVIGEPKLVPQLASYLVTQAITKLAHSIPSGANLSPSLIQFLHTASVLLNSPP